MAEKKTRNLSVYNETEALSVLKAERILRSANFKWEMRDGTLIDIKDMSESHLNNAIRMLERMEADYSCILESDIEWED